jgi:uncharacterized protein (TIGR02757 family)
MVLNRDRLEDLYNQWNRPEFISPDPLETLSPYHDVRDREVAALFAASMAYGRVNAILPPLRRVLAVMGVSPAAYVRERREPEVVEDMQGIVHRFARPVHLAALSAGIGSVLRNRGSLEASFLGGHGSGGVWSGLKSLESDLRSGAQGDPGHLLPDPARSSACKRLHLYLRWMVRRDAVDPGGWTGADPAHLMLPLDTWTYRIALRAGWTERKTADARTVREVSAALASLNPSDPVKYDFALSRFGIRVGLNIDRLFTPIGSMMNRL